MDPSNKCTPRVHGGVYGIKLSQAYFRSLDVQLPRFVHLDYICQVQLYNYLGYQRNPNLCLHVHVAEVSKWI